jgi:uncharacterized protein YaeQ
MTLPRNREHRAKLFKASVQTGLDRLAFLEHRARLRHFPSDRVERFARFIAYVNRLDQLLGPERDQYTNDNDPDFAGKCSPAMHWLWQMYMH